MGKWSKDINMAPEKAEKFADLAGLWDAWQVGKSDNLVKLQFRINKIFDAFSDQEKKQFTEYLIAQGKVDENLVRVIRLVNGSLHRLT